ncbi:hypothetical protein GHT06_011812 [Daphnia sinensis]|uniref:Glutathione transferase n=1 Tax=Daphnia sinensis TaxID=1820382 RepID=A0AAD5LEN8_9CRUS|nr:hypothetical protein GHT06_011812 [Daphnia sinensis]
MSDVFVPISETKHLTSGSTCPDVTPGLMRLYSMKFCPYAQRTRLVLAAKRIRNEVVNINLVTKPDWFFQRNPLGKVPCLEFDGKVIFESLITADYLDEAYPSPYLLNSTDPFRKAQDRILIEMFNVVNGNLYKLYRAKLDDENSWKGPIDGIQKGLKFFEEELTKREIKFFGGENPGMADYMIWPWMERLPTLPILSQGKFKVELENFPNLAKWINDMKEDSAVKESYISPENHARFITGFLSGNPDGGYGASIHREHWTYGAAMGSVC